MQVSITGRHVNVTENVKAHVEEKVNRCLHTFPKIETVHMILTEEKHEILAEIVVQAANHIRIAAKEYSENLYDAIDRSIEHAERQLRKQYDKMKDHHK